MVYYHHKMSGVHVMISISNAKWDLSDREKRAIKILARNGFDIVLDQQYLSKTVFTVTKNGISDKFSLDNGNKKLNVKQYIDLFLSAWTIREKLARK